MEAHARPEFHPRRAARSWFGVLAGPCAVLIELLAVYVIAFQVCAWLPGAWLHVAAGACVLLALAGWKVAWSEWKACGGEWPDPSSEEPRLDVRLLSSVGLIGGPLFVLLSLAQWAAAIVFDPCPR
jgi:hypothetical protein